MDEYTIQGEAARILHSVLLADPRLEIPDGVRAAARKTTFDPAALSQPFLPAPLKCSESSAALWALLAAYGNAIASDRYALGPQRCVVSSDVASLFLLSFQVLRLGGREARSDAAVAARYAAYDTRGQMASAWRRLVTSAYRTRDGRWFHLHGGLDSDASLAMLGLPPRLDDDAEEAVGGKKKEEEEKEAIARLSAAVARFDARWLDVEANEHYRQAGAVCLSPGEYAASPHGRAMAAEPLYTVEAFPGDALPPVPWPAATMTMTTTFRPLEGIKLVDVTRAIAGPTMARLAALFGATVVRVSSGALPDLGAVLFESNLGKRDADVDLKTEGGRAALRRLIADADVVLDGYRPGVLERLGFGPAYVHEVAARRGRGIVYARENCYGWKGPWSGRSGWQQISDAVTGVGWLFGRMWGAGGGDGEGEGDGDDRLHPDEPVMPPLPNSDFQTGIVGCVAIMSALDRRSRVGGNYLVSTSLNQLNSFLISLGTQSPEAQRALREKWPDMLRLRCYDDLHRQMRLLMRNLPKVAPQLFQEKNFRTMMADLGVPDEEMVFLGPAATYDVTVLQYDSGSCLRGTHKPEWPEEKATVRDSRLT